MEMDDDAKRWLVGEAESWDYLCCYLSLAIYRRWQVPERPDFFEAMLASAEYDALEIERTDGT